jgi:DNA-binding transcriptional regulator LsrR (DeoR family)
MATMQPSERIAAAMAARRYFIHDESKQDIAQAMGISRFKVARLIEQAKSEGLVRIAIDWPGDIDPARSERLSSILGVDARVAVQVPDQPSDLLVGEVCVDAVRPLLHTDSTIGVSWGRGVSAFVSAARDLPPVNVVQLIGGLDATVNELSGDALVRKLAQRTGGQPFVAQAPLAVQSKDVAQALMREPNLRETFNRCEGIDVAVIGIGAWPSSTLTSLMSTEEQDEVTQAHADVCGRMIDVAGKIMESSFYQRLIAIEIAQLRAIPHVVALTTGTEKSLAIKAACASGLIQMLITDSLTADAVLAQADV